MGITKEISPGDDGRRQGQQVTVQENRPQDRPFGFQIVRHDAIIVVVATNPSKRHNIRLYVWKPSQKVSGTR